MGNCAASTEKSLLGMTGNESRRNSAIDRKLQEQHELEKGTVKILLLGTGNSGKSTILKQFKLLHTGQGLGDPEPHKYVISSNVTKGITTLAQAARDLEQVKVDLQPENIKILEKMKELNVTNIWEEMETEDGQPQRVANLCKKLWQDPAVQEALKYEGQIAMLEVPIQYFMSNIDRIADENYVPSTEDILQARARTSGVVSIEFKVDDTECRMFDVGGQRNERKKWISHFDNVTAIMFLVSLSEYDKVLLEDSTTNRMHDALDVFRDIVECPYFEETNIILFLNKKDLFAEKIRTTDLRVCFPDYDGPQEYEPAVEYVQQQFIDIFRNARDVQTLDSMSSDIYPFQTMATNTQNVQTVFNLCRHIIFKNNLASTGML